MCQGCVDDGFVAQATYDKVEVFLREWPEAEFGAAHIVLSDLNLRDSDIRWCMEYDHWHLSSGGHAAKECDAVWLFLEALLEIPEGDR